MDSDPYTTPESKITAAPDEGPRRPVRGILLALIFDFVGTVVAATTLTILAGFILPAQGLSSSEVSAILLSDDALSPWNLILSTIGCAFSYFSGRICIQVSRGNNLLYPAILAGIGTLLTLVLLLPDYNSLSNVALTILSAGFVLLGAHNTLKARSGDD